jgi:hypothetical protein
VTNDFFFLCGGGGFSTFGCVVEMEGVERGKKREETRRYEPASATMEGRRQLVANR